ncbi:cell wall hydrolase [Bdellovibrio sp.]|uniref:cell wall hydrolase n=1 Tax=Bdellovibrio sp. TaxID=28201 RepID=UPI0039E2AC93
MRLLIAFFCVGLASSVFADESSVYSCRFENDPHGFSSIRMKRYFSAEQGMDLGKVDLIQNFIVVESTSAKVYQIPLLDNDTYIQLWYAPNLRVDAQLSYSQSSQEFRATYNKNSEKIKLVCTELRN